MKISVQTSKFSRSVDFQPVLSSLSAGELGEQLAPREIPCFAVLKTLHGTVGRKK